MIKNFIVIAIFGLFLASCQNTVVAVPANGYATPKGIDAVPSN